MKVLVIGSSGLVGSRFVELNSENKLISLTHLELDITNEKSIISCIEKNAPEVVINFAAFTNVSEAEKQRGNKDGLCWRVNVDGVKNILAAIHGKGIKLIHTSTDYVFSASPDDPGPYSEDHKPEVNSNKLTWYGFTKAESERIVGDTGTIVRLIYPVRATYSPKLDYIRKTIQMYDQGKLYPIFTDQQVSISFVDEICLAIDAIIDQDAQGVFHVSSTDTTNPFELYTYALEKIRGVKNVLTPGLLTDFLKTVDNPVRYPRFGGLKVEQTQKKLGIKFSTWKEIVDKLVEQGITV